MDGVNKKEGEGNDHHWGKAVDQTTSIEPYMKPAWGEQ